MGFVLIVFDFKRYVFVALTLKSDGVDPENSEESKESKGKFEKDWGEHEAREFSEKLACETGQFSAESDAD